MSWEDQISNKFLIHVAGNVGAYRLGKEISSGCCLIRVKQYPEDEYKMWLDDYLIPGVHYIKAAIEDIPMIVSDKSRYEEYEKMVIESVKVAKERITKESILRYIFDQLSSVS
jgi:hypothetical protein